MNDYITARDKSYLARRQFSEGALVVITERVYRYGEVALIPGDVVEIISFSNAGDRGIEASVRNGYGHTIHGVSAGLLSHA